VLICPGCQSSVDWMAELDRCPRCASAHLVRRLGEAECRDCGAVRPAPDVPASDVPASDLPAPHLPGAHLPGALPGHLATLAAAPEAAAVGGGPAASGSDLAREVEEALARVLGRT
jgi:hypothetical protein